MNNLDVVKQILGIKYNFEIDESKLLEILDRNYPENRKVVKGDWVIDTDDGTLFTFVIGKGNTEDTFEGVNTLGSHSQHWARSKFVPIRKFKAEYLNALSGAYVKYILLPSTGSKFRVVGRHVPTGEHHDWWVYTTPLLDSAEEAVKYCITSLIAEQHTRRNFKL